MNGEVRNRRLVRAVAAMVVFVVASAVTGRLFGVVETPVALALGWCGAGLAFLAWRVARHPMCVTAWIAGASAFVVYLGAGVFAEGLRFRGGGGNVLTDYLIASFWFAVLVAAMLVLAWVARHAATGTEETLRWTRASGRRHLSAAMIGFVVAGLPGLGLHAWLGSGARTFTGVIDLDGRVLVAPIYDEIGAFDPATGLAAASIGRKWGYLSRSLQFVIPPRYEETRGFDPRASMAEVKLGGKWGVIDATGNVVIGPKYDDIRVISREVIGVKNMEYQDRAGKPLPLGWGAVDGTGRVLLETLASRPPVRVGEGRFWLGGHGQPWVLYDAHGRPLVTTGFASAKHGLMTMDAKRDDLLYEPWMYVYLFGGPLELRVSPDARPSIRPSADPELLAVSPDGKAWGFIDTEGRTVIDARFEDAYNFGRGGVALAKRDGNWGLIDRSGSDVVPPRYSSAHPTGDAFAVAIDGRWGAIDSAGRVVITLEHASAPMAQGTFFVVITPRYESTVLDAQGRVVFGPRKGVGALVHADTGLIVADVIDLDRSEVFDVAGRQYAPGTAYPKSWFTVLGRIDGSVALRFWAQRYCVLGERVCVP